MDALYKELDQLRQQDLPLQLRRLQTALSQTNELLQPILAATDNLVDPTAIFTPADHAAHLAIVERFGNRKHYSHRHQQLSLSSATRD